MTIKKALLRGLLGFVLGVFICTTIALLISVCVGKYASTASELTSRMGSELNANIAQYLLSGVLGFGFAAASAIFEIDSWNFTKQTIAHFIILIILYFPTAIILGWIPFNFTAILVYFLIWVAVYAIIWFVQYQFWKKRTARMNDRIQNK